MTLQEDRQQFKKARKLWKTLEEVIKLTGLSRQRISVLALQGRINTIQLHRSSKLYYLPDVKSHMESTK